MLKIALNCCVYIFTFYSISVAQDVLVVQMNGTVSYFGKHETAQNSKPLLYGMLRSDMQLKLEKGSGVKLLRQDGRYCDLTGPGVFKISELNFLAAKEESFFNKLGDFIVSFMDASHSSESKESYKNTVLAISRGDKIIPVPEFPFPGIWPSQVDLMEFSWASTCENCKYVLEIYDMQSRELLFNTECNSTKFTLENTSRLFAGGKKYFWTIKIKDQDAEYLSSSFSVSEEADFEKKIKEIELEIPTNNLQEMSKTFFIMKSLEDSGLFNYSICYGKAQSLKLKDQQFNNMLNDHYDRLVQAFIVEQY